jgi:hypothetical protein
MSHFFYFCSIPLIGGLVCCLAFFFSFFLSSYFVRSRHIGYMSENHASIVQTSPLMIFYHLERSPDRSCQFSTSYTRFSSILLSSVLQKKTYISMEWVKESYLLPSVSTAFLLAVTIGTVEALAMCICLSINY